MPAIDTALNGTRADTLALNDIKLAFAVFFAILFEREIGILLLIVKIEIVFNLCVDTAGKFVEIKVDIVLLVEDTLFETEGLDSFVIVDNKVSPFLGVPVSMILDTELGTPLLVVLLVPVFDVLVAFGVVLGLLLVGGTLLDID